MFLDILIAMFVQLSMAIGYYPAIGLVAVATAIGIAAASWFARQAAEAVLGGGRAGIQRAPLAGGIGPSPATRRAESMDDDELRRWLENHPRDAPALKELCRRARKSGDAATAASLLERQIDAMGDADIEARCMAHHQLADLCLGPLNQPDRARKALQEFADRFPRSIQARMTCERIARIDGDESP